MPLDLNIIIEKVRKGEDLTAHEAMVLREARTAEMFRSLSQKSLCLLLSTHPSRVNTWQGEGMPRNEDGTYNAVNVVVWLKRRWIGAAEAKLARQREGLSQVELRRKQEQADKLARENAVAVGKLVSRQAVVEALDEETLMFREGLRDMDARLAPLLVGKTGEEIQRALEANHRELCERWVKLMEKHDKT